MKLRAVVLAGAMSAALLSPVSAMARESRPSELAQKLNDPEMQRQLGGALAALTEALMNVKVAPFANAMEQMGSVTGNKQAVHRIDPDATLGDLAGPEGRRAPKEMAKRLPQMMGMMAGMAGAMEAMLPQLEEMGKQIGGQMGEAMAKSMPPETDGAAESDEPAAGEATAE